MRCRSEKSAKMDEIDVKLVLIDILDPSFCHNHDKSEFVRTAKPVFTMVYMYHIHRANRQKDRELLPLDGFDKGQCFQRFPMSSWDIASKNGFWQIFCQENALKP
jgi:hypothetical protein